MGSKGTIIALRRVRAWLGHAVLIAFVMKALIPAGFMPEFSAGESGPFKIVICTASGSKIIDTAGDHGPSRTTVTKHLGEPCQLGAHPALVLPDAIASIAWAKGYDRPLIAPSVVAMLPPARAGPAHSPRAPPILS
jgi:hypothetical protein